MRRAAGEQEENGGEQRILPAGIMNASHVAQRIDHLQLAARLAGMSAAMVATRTRPSQVPRIRPRLVKR